jgi:hypothetical protein|tara:strand:+ start:912 stop:1673 length:762 start_codon:yes stop_codon:yes gene_type:complete
MKSASLPQGFFLGQIPPNWNQFVRTLSWEDAHNNRVKVRIPGKHSKGNEICDKDLPWAIVEQSTSSGNLNGSSVALWGGEWVTGYFLDKDEQIPVITGVLGVNIDAKGKINKSACSTEFKPVNRFNSGLVAKAHQIIGGPSPKASLSKIDEKTRNAATEGIDKGNESDAQEEARLAEEKTKADAQRAEEAARLAAARLAEETTEDGNLLYDNSTISDVPAIESTREERIERLGLIEVERIEQRARALRAAGAE